MKKSTIAILLLLVMIFSISAVSAADTNVTSDLGESQITDEAVELSTDDSAESAVTDAADTATDDSAKLAVDDAAAADVVESADKAVASSQNTEILTAGEKNFTQLQDEIDNSPYGMITLESNYVRVAGDNDIVINKNFNIFGNDEYKIDANNLGGIFKINEGCSVLLSNVVLVNGNGINGGAIYNEGTVNIISSTLTSNNASFGGAIYNLGIATISGSTLDGNTATTKGGAVYSTGYLVVDSTTFENNKITTGCDYTQARTDCNGGGSCGNSG